MSTKFFFTGTKRPGLSHIGQNSWRAIQEYVLDEDAGRQQDSYSYDELERVDLIEADIADDLIELITLDGKIIGSLHTPVTQEQVDAYLVAAE